jgi:hypothetical protein
MIRKQAELSNKKIYEEMSLSQSSYSFQLNLSLLMMLVKKRSNS